MVVPRRMDGTGVMTQEYLCRSEVVTETEESKLTISTAKSTACVVRFSKMARVSVLLSYIAARAYDR